MTEGGKIYIRNRSAGLYNTEKRKRKSCAGYVEERWRIESMYGRGAWTGMEREEGKDSWQEEVRWILK